LKVGPQPRSDKPPKPAKAKPKPKPVPAAPVTEIRQPEPAVPPPPEPQPEPEQVVETPPEPEAPPLPEAPVAVGSQWPKAGRIAFALLMGEQRFQMGRSVHQWQIGPDNRYRIQAVTEPTGIAAIPWFKPESVFWESTGKLTERGLQPERFSERKSLKGVTALGELNWESRVITLGGMHRFVLPDRTQDLLSLFYQLGYPGAGEIGSLPIVTGKRIEAYQFELLGTEDLALPFGQTWRTQHIRARYGQNEVTEVWTALEQFGLPVQIRLVDRKGVVYYLQATEVLVDKGSATEPPVAAPAGAAPPPGSQAAPTAAAAVGSAAVVTPALPAAVPPAAAPAVAPVVPAALPPPPAKSGSTIGPAVPVAEAPPKQTPPTERQN
ncbi:MAG TPA: DUF3108 domain-containing protein, partial [Rhodocyclaceae bacterium]|nr:DUF3108 domain-containing protein [Rhodocyclaceae bacterium]